VQSTAGHTPRFSRKGVLCAVLLLGSLAHLVSRVAHPHSLFRCQSLGYTGLAMLVIGAWIVGIQSHWQSNYYSQGATKSFPIICKKKERHGLFSSDILSLPKLINWVSLQGLHGSKLAGPCCSARRRDEVPIAFGIRMVLCHVKRWCALQPDRLNPCWSLVLWGFIKYGISQAIRTFLWRDSCRNDWIYRDEVRLDWK